MNMKEKLESLGRNSIQLKIARKETYKLGATRFGGKPDVPPDFVWPTYEGESYLIGYLSAGLREKPPGRAKMTQADHLPTFMKTAKNRERIVKLLRQMQEK